MPRSLTCLLTVMAVLALTAGCRNKPPEIPAQPAGPTIVRPNKARVYVTHATDPNRDDIRYHWNWGDGRFDTTDYYPAGDTADGLHAWTDTGSYSVRARAEDEKGNLSEDWSDSLVVLVSWTGGGPEFAGPPTGPDSGWTGVYYTFEVSAEDPDDRPVSIMFLWGDGRSSVWSDWVESGTPVSESVAYFDRGTKTIRALAMNQDSMMSDTSPAKLFYVQQTNTAPNRPSVIGPGRGIPNGPWYRFAGRASDPQGDSIQYKIIWGPGNESEWSALVPSGTQVLDSILPSSLAAWSIRVLARDQFGLVSDTSDPHLFETVGEGTILWSATHSDEFLASPALSDVVKGGETRLGVIAGAVDGTIFAVDAWQGEVLYTRFEQIPQVESYNASPSIGSDGSIYNGNENGVLYAFDNEFDLKWAWPTAATGDEFATTAVVDGNSIYVGGEGRKLHKLTDNGASVTPDWELATRGELTGSPAMLGGNLYVCDDSGWVYSVTTAGTQNWELFVGGDMTASPAVDYDGNVYVATEQGWMWSIGSSGTENWSIQIPDTTGYTFTGSPVIGTTGDIVCGADNGKVYRFDRTTGSIVWDVQLTNAQLSGTILVTSDAYLYVAADDGKLYAVKEDGTTPPNWPVALTPLFGIGSRGRARAVSVDDLVSSAVVDRWGIVYIGGDFGLFAIAGRLSGTLASTPWPMFHHDVEHTGKTSSW